MKEIDSTTIFLIDGSSFLYRAYYGLRPLHTKDGIPVQATYGFVRTIKKMIDDFNPSNMVLIWDSKGPTTRHEFYEDYKATRQAPPSDLSLQKDHIKQFADLIGLCQVEKSGYEADDIIASLAQDFIDESVVIISPDKDLRQLITNRITVFEPFKRQYIDSQFFEQKHGFKPEHLLLYHTLLGDSSDNIPGVRGIGKKGAQELTIAYHTRENMYDHIDDITNTRLRNALIAHKDDALLSEKLFMLQSVEHGLGKDDIVFDKKHFSRARSLFEKLGFKSMLASMPSEGSQTALFSDQPSYDWNMVIVQDEQALRQMIQELRAAKRFAYDTETSGLQPLIDILVGISFSCDESKSYYVPCGHVNNENVPQLSRDVVLKALKPLLEDDSIAKVLHHTKFDQLALLHYGVATKGIVFDTILAAHLLRDAWQKIGLKMLSERYLNEPMMSFKVLMGKQYKSFDQVPILTGARYAAHDALQTFKLARCISDDLDKEPTLKKMFYEMELPISQILCAMELRGIRLDSKKITLLGARIDKDLREIEAKIRGTIEALPNGQDRESKGKSINLNSPKQVEVLLFDDLELPVIKKSKEGARSTNAEVLSELSKQHPVPGMILKYRELFKLKSTYIEPLPKGVNPATGRIHTTFNQFDVATGRLSSSSPNMQNIPVTSEYGKQIRGAFIAQDGYRFMSADYSQIDLRVLAHLSGDANLVKAFNDGCDIHAQTAAQIFNVEPKQVTADQRQVGKRINFSIIYGLTPYGLSRDLDIKMSEAKKYIEAYFEQYPSVQSWMDQVVELGKEKGYVETFFGRRRYLPQLHERNHTMYEAARRIAINTPVQGTSAEVIKLAMLALDKVFAAKNIDAHMLLQIHDELLIEFSQGLEADLLPLVESAMESVVSWKVPFTVALRCGNDWQEVTK